MRIFEIRGGDPVQVPDGSTIFYIEHIPDGDHLEVWAAVPDSSVISSTEHQIEAEDDYRSPNLFSSQDDVSNLPLPTEMPVSEIQQIQTEDGSPIMFLGDHYLEVDDDE